MKVAERKMAYRIWLHAGIGLALVLCLAPSLQAASTIFVNAGAAGANSGTSWTDAYTDLQSALARAVSGDEIWVAAGTYKPTAGADRGATFQLKNGVGIYGGFAGTETTRTARSAASNITTLSGDIGAAGSSDNSYHVVVGSGTGASAVLDGFVITGGNANNPQSGVESVGGGVYSNAGNPTLANCTITGNSAKLVAACIWKEPAALPSLVACLPVTPLPPTVAAW